MHYMTKVISLSDEAYNDLKSLKANEQSFSDVVRGLAQKVKRKKLLHLAGAWKDSPEIDGIFKNILDKRHQTKGRELKF